MYLQSWHFLWHLKGPGSTPAAADAKSVGTAPGAYAGTGTCDAPVFWDRNEHPHYS